MARAGDEHEAGGVCVEAMGRARLLRIVNLLENVLECVAIETSARMHGEWSGFVEDDDRFVFVDDFNGGVDGRFGDGGEFLEITLACVNYVIWGDGLAGAVEHEAALAKVDPFGSGDMLEDAAEEFEERGAFAVRGDANGAEIIVGDTAGERGGDAADGSLAGFDGEAALLVGSLEAIRTTLACNVARIFLIIGIERGEAGVALIGLRFVETRINPDALIEDETFAVVMGAATFLEIFEDAAIELENIFEAGFLHEGRGFFAANAAGAERDDGLILKFGGQIGDGFGEIAEMIDAGGKGVFERAELDFVIVACVEQRDGAAFVEPLFERGGRDARRGVARGIDPLDTEGDDLLFDADEHAVEGLMLAFAEFDGEIGQAGNGAEFGGEFLDIRRKAGDEEIDALGAEEDGAFEVPFLAAGKEMRAPVFEIVEWRELICGDVVKNRHPERREGR